MDYFIKEADDAIGYLWGQLKQRELDSHVHIVIVSNSIDSIKFPVYIPTFYVGQ